MAAKLALVTGAGSGIGNAAAIALLDAGYLVACGYNANRAGAEAIRHAHAKAIKIDIASRASVKRAIVACKKHFGRDIDIVVNNAALAQEKPFETITDADWDQMLAVNLRGAFIVAQETLPSMQARKWGRIINITSIVGETGQAGQANYAASKAGLIGLTKSLARELASRSITVNAVAPGYIETAMTAVLTEDQKNAMTQHVPLGRVGTDVEVAHAVAFLASEEASYITGHTLDVNGGMHMA